MKESFVFYKSWKDAIASQPPDVRLEIYEAVINYATTGETPELQPMVAMAFNFIKFDLDRTAEKYQKVIERNQKNGKKGGRPKTQDNPENPVGYLETQQKHNDDEYDNEYDDDVLLKKETKEREDFKASDEPIKNPATETSKKVAQKKVSFKPPTPKEVQAYCEERQNGLNAQSFCDFYESKGWMVGKNKMISWQAAVRNWENKRNTENGTNNNRNYTGKISGRSNLTSDKIRPEFT